MFILIDDPGCGGQDYSHEMVWTLRNKEELGLRSGFHFVLHMEVGDCKVQTVSNY